ncbi:peptidylprolyl isomerase [Ideonella margarita]|uniref:Chaperone SurA n=1 Tax=Ideonella margarita TaxID=2984191 RepID=A0ABU9CA70_9BURK
MIQIPVPFRLLPLALVAALASGPAAAQFSAKPRTALQASRAADYIVAVVNNELVTQVELTQRIARAREEAQRAGTAMPADDELRSQVLESLIDERVIITFARDSGYKVDDPEVDRAVTNIATANKITMAELRTRLAADGIEYARFRANLRDQLMSERTREREVNSRIKVSDADVERVLAEQQAKRAAVSELNIAQILVSVPEGASEAVVAAKRARVAEAQARLKGGEPFELVAKAFSEDSNKDRGGEIGARPAERLPDLFVETVKTMAVGAVTAEPVRSGAGFHLLKLLSRSDSTVMTMTQTRARHILLRPSPRLSADAAQRRLGEFRDQVLTGKRSFDDLAREFSEDGSAPNGGDLGWATPGSFVPEFEEAMNRLGPGGLSGPVTSRFGVHLIQVVERRSVPVDPRQVREQARNALREQKFEEAYTEWVAELRQRAYIEMREPPL